MVHCERNEEKRGLRGMISKEKIATAATWFAYGAIAVCFILAVCAFDNGFSDILKEIQKTGIKQYIEPLWEGQG